MDGDGSAMPSSKRPDSAAVDRAKRTMFSFASSYQPTLTQMFGCPSSTRQTYKYGDDEKFGLEPVAEEPHDQSTDEAITSEVEDDGSSSHYEDLNLQSDVQRVEIRNGFDTTDQSTRIWGPYSSAGGYKSLWDRLFDDPTELEDLNLEQLEKMLDQFDPLDSTQKESSPVRLSMLTQRGRLLADEMIVRISSEPDRLAHLDSTCPKWQENVLFALHQDSVSDVQEAIDGVTHAQFKLRRLKEAMVKAIEAQEEVLAVFHEALTQSLTRFDEGGSTHNPMTVNTDSESSSSRCTRSASESPNSQDQHAREHALEDARAISFTSSNPLPK
jgi:hypothetical protein